MNLAPFVFAAARQADRDPDGCAGCLVGVPWCGFWIVVAWWLLPERWEDWTPLVGIVLSLVALGLVALLSGFWEDWKTQSRRGHMPTGRTVGATKLDATKGEDFTPRASFAEPIGSHATRPSSPPRGFKPARSGNGFTRSLSIDGWWTNCWIGRRRGVLRAKVFAPRKNGVQVQEAPLLERDCNSEEEAFAWLRDAEESGQIRREALQAIRRFETGDDDIPF